MSLNISLNSKSVADAKSAVNALTANQATKNRVNADIDSLVAANSPSVLVSVNGNGNDSDAPPAARIAVTKG